MAACLRFRSRERDFRNGMKELISGGPLQKIPYLPQILSRPGWLISFLLDGGVPALPISRARLPQWHEGTDQRRAAAKNPVSPANSFASGLANQFLAGWRRACASDLASATSAMA